MQTAFEIYAAWLAKGASTFGHSPFSHLEMSRSWDAMMATAEAANA